METELKLAIWQIAHAALDMYEDKLNGKEFEELAFNALKQVKNLNIPCVNQQRELLAAFQKDYNKRNFEDALIADIDIELFLAANSG